MGKKVVRVFLDSNVILSGLLSEKGAPRILLDLLSLRLPFLMGSTGRYNLIEIERNLKKKMPGLFPLFKDYLPKLDLKVIPLPPPEDVRGFSGQIVEKDIPVLVSAFQSRADFLVTGGRQVPPSRQSGIGGVKGHHQNEVTFAHILFATTCPGSPALWARTFTKHFGKMKGIGEYRFQIVTPSEFIDSILPEILKGLEEKN